MIIPLKTNEINFISGGKKCWTEGGYTVSQYTSAAVGFAYCLLVPRSTIGMLQRLQCVVVITGIMATEGYLLGDYFECGN